MAKDRPGTRALSLQCQVVAEGRDGIFRTCPECSGALDLHQPSLDHPSRLLGTCPGCGTWTIIDEVPEEGRLLVVRLPAVPNLMRALRPTGGAGA